MRKTLLIVLAASLMGISFAPRATAQNNPDTMLESGQPTANSPEDITIDWAEIETTISPLEEIQLPEPYLTDGSHGERQVFLQSGQVAPWAGVLLNPSAVAFIISETQASYDRARLALRLQRETDTNRLTLEVGQLRLRLRSDRAEADIVIAGQQREITNCHSLHKDYVDSLTSGFFRTKFGLAIKWGLVVIGAAAVGAVVGYIAHP